MNGLGNKNWTESDMVRGKLGVLSIKQSTHSYIYIFVVNTNFRYQYDCYFRVSGNNTRKSIQLRPISNYQKHIK